MIGNSPAPFTVSIEFPKALRGPLQSGLGRTRDSFNQSSSRVTSLFRTDAYRRRMGYVVGPAKVPLVAPYTNITICSLRSRYFCTYLSCLYNLVN